MNTRRIYPRTPIHIHMGVVYAYIWNGQERSKNAPVYRLKKPQPGHSRNGRLLSYPTRGIHVTVGSLMHTKELT
jgi:hypothetical protein